MYLYTCMESADMTAPPAASASRMESSVFPTAVGPVKIISGFFMLSPPSAGFLHNPLEFPLDF